MTLSRLRTSSSRPLNLCFGRRVTAHPSVLAWARREGILDLDPDLLDTTQWMNKEVDLGGGMGKGTVIKIGGR